MFYSLSKLVFLSILLFAGGLNHVNAQVNTLWVSHNMVSSVDNYSTPAGIRTEPFYVQCPSGYQITALRLRTRTLSAPTVDSRIVIAGYTSATTTITGTTNAIYTWFFSTPVPCNGLDYASTTFGLPMTMSQTDRLVVPRVNTSSGANPLSTTSIALWATTTDRQLNATLALNLPIYFSTSTSENTMSSATTTIIQANDQLLNFTMLLFIFVLVSTWLIWVFRPFYVSK